MISFTVMKKALLDFLVTHSDETVIIVRVQQGLLDSPDIQKIQRQADIQSSYPLTLPIQSIVLEASSVQLTVCLKVSG